MLQKEVEVGKVYIMLISRTMTKVRVVEELEYTMRTNAYTRQTRKRWRGLNLRTGREVLIKSAAKLRKELGE